MSSEVERHGIEARPLLPASLEDRLRGGLRKLSGLALALAACAGWLCLLTYAVNDPSLTHTTSGPTHNLLGPIGAIVSDLLLQLFGFAGVLALLGPAWAGGELMLFERLPRARLRAILFALAVALLAGALSSLASPAAWPLSHGLGGAGGDLVFNMTAAFVGIVLPGHASGVAGLALFAGGMSTLSAGLGLTQQDWSLLIRSSRSRRPGTASPHASGHAPWPHPDATDGSAFSAAAPPVRGPMPGEASVTGEPAPADLHDFDRTTEHASSSIAARFAPAGASAAPATPARRPAEIIGSLISFRPRPADYRRPSLNILKRPPAQRPGAEHTQPVLRGSARLLEDVLADFGIKGEVKGIKPGPVVTLFEVEPARGTKASRIVALADDIARSMSATSARVATVPGRNVIGIELPNVRRETVYLRELLEHESWRQTEAQLPIVLGKDIGGEPVIADLARMPHLLVAGTTGSGKSVGVNALILSLLYRLSPAECRLLMIDPKMLELSVYNAIPHLLAPVVTDPHLAAAALAWAVGEMEERYKRMAELGVRNIEMFNVRAKNARKRGEMLGRTVQTGFDAATGEAVYARSETAAEPMPYIVIVVDEFADLMAVAGKEIEGTVQRLAQMARAAGIHLVMATQRPSVDVVTGTIKANFPSRIAFRVASKIDSRTILGETGADQLLGSGDMLFSGGSGQIVRVHGPFVSDEEVERVATALREGNEPAYVESLARQLETAPSEPGTSPAATAAAEAADELFDRAVAIVHRDRKASTSYLQRRLAVGYNRAADLIERMEREGLVSAADSVGRRRVLIGEDPQDPDRE